MQANKLGWVGCIVLIGMTACGTDNAAEVSSQTGLNVSMQAVDSSEEALSEEAMQIDSMMQSVDRALVTKPGCPPASGNTKGVGRPCSKNGGQCKGSGAPFCTVDVSSSTKHAFCTKMCFTNDQCGANATCASNPHSPGMKGCVPNACL